jgi:hypothetical protein
MLWEATTMSRLLPLFALLILAHSASAQTEPGPIRVLPLPAPPSAPSAVIEPAAAKELPDPPAVTPPLSPPLAPPLAPKKVAPVKATPVRATPTKTTPAKLLVKAPPVKALPVKESAVKDPGAAPSVLTGVLVDTQVVPDAKVPDAKAPDAKAPDEKAAEPGVAELAKAVEAIGKRLTVLTVSDELKLIIGGQIVGDFMYHSSRPVAPGTPFFLRPGSPFGFEQDTFDAHARQTALTFLVMGPKVCDLESGGVVLLTLYNDALIVDRYGILPVLAFGQLKNDEWRFAAGLQLDIFNPLNPTVLPFSYLFGSGNAGTYRGQARVERYFYPGPESQITLTGGISDPTPTILSSSFDVSEDNGWPNVEGRIAVGFGPLEGEGLAAKRPIELAVSGIVGQIRNTIPVPAERIVANIRGIGVDARYAFTERCGVQGEIFYGQTLGSYGAGVLQTVNTSTFEPIRTSGGFGEFYYYWIPDCLHSHLGYGIDDPNDNDVAPGQVLRNETYFVNLIWDVTKHFRVAGEVTYRKTSFSFLRDNDGVGFHTQVMWKF